MIRARTHQSMKPTLGRSVHVLAFGLIIWRHRSNHIQDLILAAGGGILGGK